jgi:Domain of unknown function (DUF4129)
VASPDYRLDAQLSQSHWTEELILTILEWILTPLRWLFDLTEGLPDVLRWLIVVVLVIVLVGLIWHMAYSFMMAMRRPTRVAGLGLADRQRGFSPEELEQLAAEADRAGNHIAAIRFLFRASVARLEFSLKQKHRPGATNRELLRRFSQWPEMNSSVRFFVDVIDRKWYGDEHCSEFDYAESQAAYHSLCSFLRERGHALGT